MTKQLTIKEALDTTEVRRAVAMTRPAHYPLSDGKVRDFRGWLPGRLSEHLDRILSNTDNAHFRSGQEESTYGFTVMHNEAAHEQTTYTFRRGARRRTFNRWVIVITYYPRRDDNEHQHRSA